MKRLMVVMLIAWVVGCSSAPEQSYRPSGSTEAPWRITGQWKESLLGDDTVLVNIDGQEVIKGKFPLLDNTMELSGEHQGKRISVSCIRTQGWLGTKIQAIVFVENERAATLQF